MYAYRRERSFALWQLRKQMFCQVCKPEKPEGLSGEAALMRSPDTFHKSHPRNS